MRIAAAAVSLVLAAVLAPLVIAGLWIDSKIEHTDAYVATVQPLGSDPTLRGDFGDALGAAVAEKLAEKSPIGLPGASGDLIRQAAVDVVNEPGFPQFWRRANRKAHRQFLALMHDDRRDPSGFLFVDATPLLSRVFAKLEDKGLPMQLLSGVPLEIPVASMSKLEDQRGHYLLLTRTARFGPWVWGLLVAFAVAIAPGWRGRLRAAAVAALGVGVGAVLLMLAPGPLTSYGAAHSGVGKTELVRLILRVVLDSLGPYARTYAVIAVPVALALFLISLIPTRRRAPYPAYPPPPYPPHAGARR